MQDKDVLLIALPYGTHCNHMPVLTDNLPCTKINVLGVGQQLYFTTSHSVKYSIAAAQRFYEASRKVNQKATIL